MLHTFGVQVGFKVCRGLRVKVSALNPKPCLDVYSSFVGLLFTLEVLLRFSGHLGIGRADPGFRVSVALSPSPKP